jgi:hypothetical protein
MRITFIRMREPQYVIFSGKDVPAQEAGATFSRQMLETGHPEQPILTIADNIERWRWVESGRLCVLAPKTTVLKCLAPNGVMLPVTKEP